jgi:hypothetical protein
MIHFIKKLVIIQAIKKFRADRQPQGLFVLHYLRLFQRGKKEYFFLGCNVMWLIWLYNIFLLFHKEPNFPEKKERKARKEEH